jgi:hypothetical protein
MELRLFKKKENTGCPGLEEAPLLAKILLLFRSSKHTFLKLRVLARGTLQCLLDGFHVDRLNFQLKGPRLQISNMGGKIILNQFTHHFI